MGRVKYVVDDTDDYDIPLEDENRFLGIYAWEAHLNAFDRWRLYVARVGLAENPGHADHFALTLASTLVSAEFADDFAEAGDDLHQRALIRLEAELNAYW